MPRTSAIALFAWPLVAIAAGGAPPVLQDAVAEYQRRADRVPAACASDESVALAVAADPPVEATYDATTGRLHLHYAMFFNDLTEGWNWHPEEAAAGRDYYAYKFLPLASRLQEGVAVATDDASGRPARAAARTRTDYFFAFDNPYDFYSRDAGDAMGFHADVALPAGEARRIADGGSVRLALGGRLASACLSGSKTFWKATVSAPVDYTLLKRYLVGTLTDIWFLDERDGRVLAHLEPARR